MAEIFIEEIARLYYEREQRREEQRIQAFLSPQRFPQFYSRIGFVHAFRPLDAAQLQQLVESRWAPAGVKLPAEQLLPEVIASLIRMTGGNLRLLARLLTQIERVLDVNELPFITNAVVEAARDSLVIGPA